MEDLCLVCGKTVSRKNFARHQKSHSDEKNYVCFHCAKKFKTRDKLNQHMKTHRQPTLKKCQHCSKELFSDSALRKHIMTKHENIKYECPYCKKGFPSKNLTRKMIEWSVVMPRFIREKKGMMHKIFKLEQEGEHLHQLLNALETRYKSVYNKSERYFLMLKEYENKMYVTK